MSWVFITSGPEVRVALQALELLGMPRQVQNDGQVLLSTAEGASVLRLLQRLAYYSGASLDDFARARAADPERFSAIVDGIHTAFALDPNFDPRESIVDLLKLGAEPVEK